MQTQQMQLEEVLAEEGWRIAERESPCSEWWLDEVWILESVWSPAGRRAYVSFIVDPAVVGHRRKGEHVWAVAIGTQRPDSWRCDVVPLRPRWEGRRDDVVAGVRKLRDPSGS